MEIFMSEGGGVAGECAQVFKEALKLAKETTTGVHRLKEMAAKGKRLSSAINFNHYVTKCKILAS